MLDQVPRTEPPLVRDRGNLGAALALWTLVGLTIGIIASHPLVGTLLGLAAGIASIAVRRAR